jgi:hypothetical protein
LTYSIRLRSYGGAREQGAGKLMEEWDGVRYHDPIANLELSLVERVMRVIQEHHLEHEIELAPASLRDSMLAVAAMLHIEAAKSAERSSRVSQALQLPQTFATTAEEQIRAVLSVVSIPVQGIQ